MSYFTRNLNDDEELVDLVRRHGLNFLPAALLAMLLLALPFFLLFLLWQWKNIGLLLFVFLLAVGVLAMIRVLLVWYYNALVITNQRVILYKQKGFFERQVLEAEYGKIQDTSYIFKGLWQTLFHFGSLRIQVVNSETILVVEKIPTPAKVQDLIKNIQKNCVADGFNRRSDVYQNP